MDEGIKVEADPEIKEALKEFELESGTTQTVNITKVTPTPDTSGMVGFVIKHSSGMIKNQRTAEYVLLGFVVVVIVISVFIFFNGSRIFENNLNTEQGEEIIPGQIPGEI